MPLRITGTQKEQNPNKPTNSFLDEGLEIPVIAATLRLSSGAGINISAFFSGLFFLCLHTLKKKHCPVMAIMNMTQSSLSFCIQDSFILVHHYSLIWQ